MATPYGSRLLPTVVDETATSQPDLTYAYVPINNSLGDGFTTITFADVATATNYMAAWIHQNLGRSTSFQMIAYMGPGDLRYVPIFLAAVKCGYKVVNNLEHFCQVLTRTLILTLIAQVLLPSPRKSAWMNASLLEQTQCRHFLIGSDLDSLVTSLLEHVPDLHLHKIEALSDMIRPGTQHYSYDKQYDTVKWDPILVLHSSGSTGPPANLLPERKAGDESPGPAAHRPFGRRDHGPIQTEVHLLPSYHCRAAGTRTRWHRELQEPQVLALRWWAALADRGRGTKQNDGRLPILRPDRDRRHPSNSTQARGLGQSRVEPITGSHHGSIRRRCI